MNKSLSLVRTYEGKQADATAKFQADAAVLSADGYVPTSQNWIPGQRGCRSVSRVLQPGCRAVGAAEGFGFG